MIASSCYARRGAATIVRIRGKSSSASSVSNSFADVSTEHCESFNTNVPSPDPLARHAATRRPYPSSLEQNAMGVIGRKYRWPSSAGAASVIPPARANKV